MQLFRVSGYFFCSIFEMSRDLKLTVCVEILVILTPLFLNLNTLQGYIKTANKHLFCQKVFNNFKKFVILPCDN